MNTAKTKYTNEEEFIVQDFNEAWIDWFKIMAEQMPEIKSALEHSINLAETVNVVRFYALMENFAYYTQAHLHELLRKDPIFLEKMVEKASKSKHKLMPTEFMEQYKKASPEVQQSIFETVQNFAALTTLVREDYCADFRRAEIDVFGKKIKT